MTTGGICKIMIVDDEVLIRQGIKHFMNWEQEGFQIVGEASNGQEALDLLHGTGLARQPAMAGMPELVLLDLKLPKVGGIEVLQRLRSDARTRRLPVVILTSSQEESDRIATYDLGANSYVRKPVDFAEFTEAARHIGVYWLDVNEAPPPV